MGKILAATLTRKSASDEGTFGIFELPELGFSCLSLELPDRANRPSISRVNPGDYIATWAYSPRKQRYTYRLQDKNDRVGVLIHSASFGGDKKLGYDSDLEGCISLGADTAIVTLNNGHQQHIITKSRDTIRKFELLTNGLPLALRIINEPKTKRE